MTLQDRTERASVGKTGRQLIIEQFLADGMKFMFGNPGTVEQGFLDALEEYPEFQYVLTMQETIAVAMADGYARATNGPALVQLHSGVGLGNGVGMLYQAMRGHAPLVVVAGESGVQYDAMDAQMAADLVAIARPVTKYATRVVDPASLLRVLRRAVKIATTPPTGPVFVALPMDVLDAVIQDEVVPSTRVRSRVTPASDDLEQAATLLAGASRPVVLMGDGITFSGAHGELARVAELLGAPVYGVNSSEINMPSSHPLYGGTTGHMFGEDSQRLLKDHDAALIVGTYVFPEVFPLLSGAFAPNTRLVHVDLNAYEMGKNFPVELALLGDPKSTLAALGDLVATRQNDEDRASAAARSRAFSDAKRAKTEAIIAHDFTHRDDVPLRMSRFMDELSSRLPEGAVIVDEALTSSPEITRYLPDLEPGQFLQTRGGSLGIGIPGALGAKLAHPDREVIGFTGDGGSMYTIQALWTAAHHDIGAKFVICNNQSYKLLKLNIAQYWRERGLPAHEFPKSFDLHDPIVDFAALSRSMGVPAEKVETPEQVGPAIERMLASDGPYLIDLVLSKDL
ncbi:thiamine pyrophosphate-binding protein [Deinococcus yavapaiensis]|uniref:Benzoylformate decarboxylase n=1 Tax=Deinococcus yavapaiensis KR-236 TaxID=694435 RepID=A0A318S764_9DEIO|nr:thiamine pyrophosphate-binding protein [Deinococcus yavapaiensis]PYE54806.1 benzoylformate decarboxylase [Deinococcus yavapaiensis KR-236]